MLLELATLYGSLASGLFLWRSRNRNFFLSKHDNTIYADVVGIYCLLKPGTKIRLTGNRDQDIAYKDYTSFQAMAHYFNITRANAEWISLASSYTNELKEFGDGDKIKEIALTRVHAILVDNPVFENRSRLLDLYSLVKNAPPTIKYRDKEYNLQFKMKINGFINFPPIITNNNVFLYNLLYSIGWPLDYLGKIGKTSLVSLKKVKDFLTPAA